jgi:thioesterase domain-containing protein/acyl carrier protein
MKSNISEKLNSNQSVQNRTEKNSSDLWETVKVNIKLRHQAPSIVSIPQTANMPLSFAQERLWLLDQLHLTGSLYNMRAAYRLNGLVNITALYESIDFIARRHDILRTTFQLIDGQPIQVIAPEIDWKLPVVDLRTFSEAERKTEIKRLIAEELNEPFDLSRNLLWRVKLLCLAEEEYLFIRTVHHIIFDGWSYRMFMRELVVLYKAFCDGNPSPLSKLPIQYVDFAVWQRQWLQGDLLEHLLDYWKKQLSGNVSPLELPIDRPRKFIPNYQGASKSLMLSETLTEALKTLSHQEGVSLFVTLLTAFKTLLYQYTMQKDMIVCSPVAGRYLNETKRLIGYFNNIVVLRTDLSDNPKLWELIGRVSRVTLGAYEHQDLPFQKLVEIQNLASTPLNRGMFALQNTPSQPLNLGQIALDSLDLDLDSETTNFDWFMSVTEKEGKLKVSLHYKTDLFDDTSITQILENFQTLLESVVANPDQYLEDLPLFGGKNGKVDQQELSVPDSTEPTLKTGYVVPRNQLELDLTQIWQQVLNLEKISILDNFFEIGGHSLLVMHLFAKIQKKFGQNLPLSTLFQFPTIAGMSEVLRQLGCSNLWSSLVPIQPKGTKLPLFCVHDVFGDVLSYGNLVHHLGEDQPVYGLQAQGLDGQQSPCTQMGQIATNYIKEIKNIQPQGPYFLAGHSFGGVVIFEMAQQLHRQGERVALLALIDTAAPGTCIRLSFHERLPIHLENIYRQGLGYLWLKSKQWKRWIKNRLEKLEYKLYKMLQRVDVKRPLPYTLRNFHMREASSHALDSYSLQVYPGSMTLFQVNRESRFEGVGFQEVDPQMGWGKWVAGSLDIQDIEGSHASVLQEPHVKLLAEKLKNCLSKQQS